MKAGFTTCTTSYLGDARVLRESFLNHNPGYRFFIFLIDKNIDPQFLTDPGIVDVKTIGINEQLSDMYGRYNSLETCCALKPFVGKYLLQTYESIIYFDTDILVMQPLTLIEDALKTDDILLTPHHYKDEVVPQEKVLVRSGLANAGFFAVNRSDNGNAFLQWWSKKTFAEGYFNLYKDMYSDQMWLTFVPFYFDKVRLIRQPGTNIAIWNLDYRKITKKGEQFFVNNEYPLIFFHFSGFKLDVKNKTYKFPIESPSPAMKELLDRYYQLLISNKSDSLLVQFDKKNKKVPKGAYHHFKIRALSKLQIMMKNFSAYLENKKKKYSS